MTISEWIAQARGHKAWSQEKLAAEVGRTKANVSHWERRKHEPSLAQLLLIAEKTGYPLGRLVWPLPKVDAWRYFELADDDRVYVQAKMMAAIEERERVAVKRAERRVRQQQVSEERRQAPFDYPRDLAG